MTEVQCPVCDYVLELNPVDVPATLLQALGVDNAGVDTMGAELVMAEHLAEHTVLDWVTALRMADVYIAKLEDDAHSLANHVSKLIDERDHWKAVGESKVELRAQVRNGALAGGYGAPAAPNGDFGAYWEQLSPKERQDKLAQDRKAGVVRTIPDTLIPFIPSDRRPEGVVGRKR